MQRDTRHAPYGTACANCSRSKCRCIILNAGGPCERCGRLKKVCLPLGRVRKRNAKELTASKNSQLEAKIDGLVCLLKSSSSGTMDATKRSMIGSIEDSLDNAQASCEPSHEPAISNVSATAAIDALLETSEDQEEELLTKFRTLKLIHFPFLYIPLETSAAEIRSARPFLWLCIVAVSTRSALRASKLFTQIRSIVAQTMVAELERNFEQLLGLLVCIAWGNFQVRKRPFLTVFVQLAISVVFDLGLNKTPLKGLEESSKYRFHKSWVLYGRTMEERRAVLGCYFMSSIVSSYLHRIDTLRWTSHMDECLQELTERKECPADAVLVALVKLRMIVEKVRSSPWQDEELSGPITTKPPPEFYARALQAEMEDTKLQIPSELHNDAVLLSYLHHTEFTLHEFAISNRLTISPNPGFGHLESLYTCLTALKSYFEVFFTFTSMQYIGFSTSTLFQLMHCIFSLHKLSTIEDPALDKNTVARVADMTEIGQKVSRNLRDVSLAAELECDRLEDLFSRLAAMVDSKLHSRGVVDDLSLREQSIEGTEIGEFGPELLEQFWVTDLLVSLG